MKFIRFIYILLLFSFVQAANLDFDLVKKGGEEKGNTLLVVGGIHGNEPGGFFAPAILAKYYTITKGELWVIPNLNFDSIISNARGIYGDMNRKFSNLEKSDKDYEIIQRVKKLILDKNVDLILNLHDGHGFYRPKYENSIFNPNAWGQATIIDQDKIHGLDKFGNLDKIAKKVSEKLNNDGLFEHHHSFGVKNTQTKFKDEQQQLSLTYFAVTNDKPAFAIETSKNITDLTQKVVYQLKSIEEFMNIMDIKYSRSFDLDSYDEVKKLIYDFGNISINDNIKINLNDIRKNIKFVPMKKSNNKIEFDNTLAAFKKVGTNYDVYLGNMKLTKIKPQYFDIKNSDKKISIIVDDEKKLFNLAQTIDIKDSFKIEKSPFRVNIIGYSKKGIKSEDGITIKKSDIQKNYSLDKKHNQYRAEFYKDKKFYGMIVLNFIEN